MHPQVSCVDVCKPPHPQHILEAGIRDWHSMVGTRVPQSREPINPASFSSVCPQSHVCPRTGVPKAGQPRTEDQPHVELGGSLGAHAWPCFCRVGGDSPTRGLLHVAEALAFRGCSHSARGSGWTQCPSGQVPQALTDTHGCDPARPGLA